MYDTESEFVKPENNGPYYVPWKKSSMSAYDKYHIKKIYKNSKGYLPDSTIGNVPTENQEDTEN